MSDLILECRNAGKRYRDKEVLKNISLKLEKGKIYGLIGRNGAGKTTLLSLLSAQNPKSSGEILLNGREIWENQEALRHIYFSRELYGELNDWIGALKVKEYFRIASQYLPKWDGEIEKRLEELFHLDRGKKISKLSKGMRSMVSIISALASRADFTFLDEPLSGLDIVSRETFYRLLLEEFTESGRTFVISTHIIEEAEDLFDETLFLHQGELLLKENTQDLLESCFYVSGLAQDVDQAVKGRETHCEEAVGRSKGLMVRLKKGEAALSGEKITVQPMNLQKIFLALCKEEKEI